jgi:hypothetical protein
LEKHDEIALSYCAVNGFDGMLCRSGATAASKHGGGTGEDCFGG